MFILNSTLILYVFNVHKKNGNVVTYLRRFGYIIDFFVTNISLTNSI